jgi:response regulator NasT
VSTLKAILVELEPARTPAINELLAAADCETVAHVSDINEVSPALVQHGAQLVALSVSSPEQPLLDSLVMLQGNTPTPIILFSADDDATVIRRAVQCGVSAYVTDGVNPTRVRAVLEAGIARFRQFKALADELVRTRSQLAERKTIERAKGLIMSQRGLAEDQAYKLLRKTAMDRNKRMVDIAESIIAAAELLGEPDSATEILPADVA